MPTENCPCCEHDMNGSDHCPFCGCEAYQSYETQHLRNHVLELRRRLRVVRGATEDLGL